MINPLQMADVPVKKELTLFYVIDNSGSMSGEKLNKVNVAIGEAVDVLQEINEGPDANVKVASLKFSTNAEWIHAPMSVDNFTWRNLLPEGVTNFGDAIRKLNEKLTREGGYLTPRDAGTMAVPVIILMSDGGPTDSTWPQDLEEIKKNAYFKAALKFAIAIGNDAEREPLERFTGNSEAVYIVHSGEDLRKLIKVVSYTSATLGSKSASVGAMQGDVNNMANRAIATAVAGAAADVGVNIGDWDGDDVVDIF